MVNAEVLDGDHHELSSPGTTAMRETAMVRKATMVVFNEKPRNDLGMGNR